MDNGAGKNGDQGNVSATQQGPLMILSSGKVVGNVAGKGKEQWKEVRDNRAKKTTSPNRVQIANGKELVPVAQGERQQVQLGNKFALLGIEADGIDVENEVQK